MVSSLKLINQKKNEKYKKNLFFVLSVYFFIEYVRPQSFLNIDFLRPGLLIISFLFLYVLFYNDKKELIDSKIIIIFIFTFLLFIYIPFSANTYYAYHAFYAIIILLPPILSIVICIDNLKRLYRLNWLFSFLTIFISIYLLANGGYGPGGIVRDANDASLFLVMMLPFSYYLLLIEKNTFKKIFLIFTLTVSIGAIAYASSRSAFVGVMAVAFVLFLFSKNKLKVLIVLLLLAISFIYFANETFLEELQGITDTQESTANERLLTWESSWNMFIDNPLGVGGKNFPIHFTDYQVDGFRRPDMWGRAAHSLWFTLLPETGIAGTILFFSIIYMNYKTLFRVRREFNSSIRKNGQEAEHIYFYSTTLIASLSGFLSAGTFLSVLYYPHFWILTSLIVAVNKIALSHHHLEGR